MLRKVLSSHFEEKDSTILLNKAKQDSSELSENLLIRLMNLKENLMFTMIERFKERFNKLSLLN